MYKEIFDLENAYKKIDRNIIWQVRHQFIS